MNEGKEFDKEKFKNIIHYIIHVCQDKYEIGRTVLYKLLYFSDFNYYELYEISLTGEKYIHKPNGPIPKNFIECKDELITEGKIIEETKKVIDFSKYIYSSIQEPSINFSEKELNVIDDCIVNLAPFGSRGISNYSHGDKPWRLSKEGQELNYEAVFYRSPKYSVRDYGEGN